MANQPTPDERRFRALASSSVERIVELDPRGQTVFASPSHVIAGDDVLASLDHVHPDDRTAVAEHFAAAFGAGAAARVTFRVRDRDGSTRWIESTLTPFLAEDGERHVLVVSRDATEARLGEQQLRESRERFQLIAENAYDMIVEYDSEWRLQYVNDRVQRVLGFGDANSEFDSDMVHPDDRERVAAMFTSVREGRAESAHSTYRLRRADGGWCWIDGSLRTSPQSHGSQNFLIIARDATARVEAEQLVRESEQRYRELVESAPLGIFVVQNDRIVFANEAAAALCGRVSPEAICGTDVHELLDEEAVRSIVDTVTRSGRGDNRPSTFAIHPAGQDAGQRDLTGVGTVISYAGAPAFQCIVRDVTELEHSLREQQRLELQLQEARKLESLGVLAGGIAHDFNNLLAVILSSVRYARSRDATPEDRVEALGDAEEAAESAARLVKQLLAYAGRRSPEVCSVDLSELAGSLSELLSTALPGGVALQLDLAREPLMVHADLVQLEQVLMNLVLNAADAVDTGPGTVTVRTSRESLSPQQLAQWLGGEDLAGGWYACLEVADSGVGMDAETRARIFEPFFSTKQNGHGLGLSAVLGLVQGHRGAIDVRSDRGVGTQIRVFLPADPIPVQPTRRSGAPVILVAVPDPGLRGSAVDTLRRAGMEVVEAADVAQVLDLWALHGEELDAAVIDTAFSAAGGQRLAQAFHADRPELPMLVLCAADDEPIAAERDSPAAFLRKPFTEELLKERMAGLLAKRSERS